MKKYALTSASFKGEITYTYNKDGFLINYSNDAELDEKQMRWILKWMPMQEIEIAEFFGEKKPLNLVEVPFKVSFEMMWDKYNDKSRSSRLKSLKSWGKMNETDQLKAYNYIHTYNRNRGQAEKKHLTTYLSDQLWNN